MNPRQTMPEAQALRTLLTDAAKQVAQDIADMPSKAGVKLFLERYLDGKTVTEIARELGVSREWCSRAFRKEAFTLAGAQFMRLVSTEDS
jgi:DNA-directed RNA polymerase specialized sigma24 family protein